MLAVLSEPELLMPAALLNMSSLLWCCRVDQAAKYACGGGKVLFCEVAAKLKSSGRECGWPCTVTLLLSTICFLEHDRFILPILG